MRTLVVFLAASLAMSGCALAPGGVAPSPRPDAEARLRANGVLSHNGSQLVAAGAGNALPKAGIVSAGAGNALPSGNAGALVAAGAGNVMSPTGKASGDLAAQTGNQSALAPAPAVNGGSLVGNNGNASPTGDAGKLNEVGGGAVGFADLAGFAPGAGFAIGGSALVGPGPTGPKITGPGPGDPLVEDVVKVNAGITGKLLAPGAGGLLRPVVNVKARLYNLAGIEIASAATGADGGYSISTPDVPLGLYVVRAAFKAGASESYMAALVDVAGTAATADLDPGTTMLEAHLFAAAAEAPGSRVELPPAGALAGWNQAATALATKVPATALAPGLSATERDKLGAGLRTEAENAFAGVAGLVVAR